MDEPSAPWRALESGVGSAGPLASPGDPSQAPRRWEPHLVATAGALGLSAVLGVVAVWLVVGSGRGSVVVDGDRPAAAASTGADRAVGSSGGRIVVDVQGAVAHPGIVELAPGARVGDAIAAAGGFGPRVASDRVGRALNLAALVHDGDQIVVPSRDDPAGGSGGSAPAGDGGAGGGGAGGTPVDLNHATAAELDALPGVGPATAAKIIAARTEQPFTSVEDLRTRKILGEAAFAKLRDLVTVR